MFVSVEHQYTTNFKLYWKCRKITITSKRQNKAEAWPSKEASSTRFKGLYKEIGVKTEKPSQKLSAT